MTCHRITEPVPTVPEASSQAPEAIREQQRDYIQQSIANLNCAIAFAAIDHALRKHSITPKEARAQLETLKGGKA